MSARKKLGPNLKTLLTECALAHGPYKLVLLEKVRNYIAAVPIAKLSTEIEGVESMQLMRILQGAGVPGGARDTFLLTLQRIIKRYGPEKHG